MIGTLILVVWHTTLLIVQLVARTPSAPMQPVAVELQSVEGEEAEGRVPASPSTLQDNSPYRQDED